MRETTIRALHVCAELLLLVHAKAAPIPANQTRQIPFAYASGVALDFKEKTITLTRPARKQEKPLGTFRNLKLQFKDGRYILNDAVLEQVSGRAFEIGTQKPGYKVRLTLLKHVLLIHGQPVNHEDQELIVTWQSLIPLVSEILKGEDAIGSLKLIIYDLVEPKSRTDLQLQEELMLLWSADPADSARIGKTHIFPPRFFPGQLVDVQYRGIKNPINRLPRKIYLQVLYVLDQGEPTAVGSFLIASEPSGEYEFYAVPLGSVFSR